MKTLPPDTPIEKIPPNETFNWNNDMSVQLQSYTETGTECPYCHNKSVFKKDVTTKWFGLYRYTLIECKLGDCKYKRLIDLSK